MAATRPRYTEVVQRQLSQPSPFMAADYCLKLENVSYGQLQVLSAVRAQNAASAMVADRETSPEFYVDVSPPITEGPGVVKRFQNGDIHTLPMHADWFDPAKVHNLERRLSLHTEKYMNFRNSIVAKYIKNPEKRLSINECIEMKSEFSYEDTNRIYRFLESWGIINYCANEPTPDHESLSVGSYLMEDIDGAVHLSSAGLNSIDCLIKLDKAKCSIKASSGDDISELENRIMEKLAQHRCKYCSKPLLIDCYQSVKEADVMLCLDCYHEGRFVVGHSGYDFSKFDSTKDGQDHNINSWTDQETVLLLEAMEIYNDDWNEISDYVGSKSKMQCILHFLRMPIEHGLLSNLIVPDPNENSEDSCIQDSDSYNRLPFLNFGNPVMALVAFLASSLGPKAAAACAHSALLVLSECEGLSLNPLQERNSEDGSHDESRNPGQCKDVPPNYGEKVKSALKAGLVGAAIKAKLLADQEEREIQRYAAVLTSAQLKRLDLKLTQFTEIDNKLLKQSEQLEKATQKFAAERAIYMTRYQSLLMENENALMSAPSSSSFTAMLTGFGSQMNYSKPAFSLGHRLPFSVTQPSSSLHAQNGMFNPLGIEQPSFGYSMSRFIPGTTSSQFS